MSTPENQTKLFTALIAAIAETKDVHADSNNPHYGSRYASLGAHLSALKPIFAKHGLAIVQLPMSQPGTVGLLTSVIHKDGGHMEAYIGIPTTEKTDAQKTGSTISYLRRYALASLAGCATEDDDGEATVRPTQSVAKTNYIPNPTHASVATVAAPAVKASGSATAEDLGITLAFGKFKGQTIGQVVATKEGKSWLEWMSKQELKMAPDGKPYKKDVQLREAVARALSGGAAVAAAPVAEDEPFDDVPF